MERYSTKLSKLNEVNLDNIREMIKSMTCNTFS